MGCHSAAQQQLLPLLAGAAQLLLLLLQLPHQDVTHADLLQTVMSCSLADEVAQSAGHDAGRTVDVRLPLTAGCTGLQTAASCSISRVCGT